MKSKAEIKYNLLTAGVFNLKKNGYPEVNIENILTDEVYSMMFSSMLSENLGHGKAIDKAINELKNEIKKSQSKEKVNEDTAPNS